MKPSNKLYNVLITFKYILLSDECGMCSSNIDANCIVIF